MSETETETEIKTEPVEPTVAERFAGDVAEHRLEVLRDDGLYRHLRFRRENGSWYWFDLVTWPGVLAIRGDMHHQMFARTRDMFEFFRGQRANYGYWAEKTPDCGRAVREYDPDRLRAQVKECLSDYAREHDHRQAEHDAQQARYDRTERKQRWPWNRSGPREPDPVSSVEELRELVREHDEDGLLEHPDGARDLLRELERRHVASDTWEWDLTEYTYQFRWACHAIPWGIAQYDAARAAARAEAVRVEAARHANIAST